jgi:tetratricopeptide (TPR) repeat protein
MDVARPTGIRWKVVVAVAFCCSVTLAAQVGTADPLQKAKELAEKEQWQEVVALADATPARSPELDYFYGVALAHLERWPQAHEALAAGEKALPKDERFPIELAGVDFKQKNYSEAANHLRRALHLNPTDPYANEFLATVYYLEGNLEAAVKYWNKVNKPKLAEVKTDPKPRVDAALLDHAFTFAPASLLRREDLLSSEARIEALEIFPNYTFDLQARDDGQFNLIFRNQESNGFGNNKWAALIRTFRGLPAQTVNPEFYNFHGKAINMISMYRWDAEKRRVFAELSGPLRLNPKRRISFGADLRGENWDIRPTFKGQAPVLGSFNMRREAINAKIMTIQSGHWSWSAGTELSHRDFRDIFLGSALTPELLSKAYQLKQTTQINADLLRFPERRFTITSSVTSDIGRIWSSPAHAFEKLQASLLLHWLPKAQGDDYELQHQFRAGKTWGTVPFDELFTLGGLGDNKLQMRGHITTHSGRKGSGPLGRNYFLSNLEIDKHIFHDSFVTVKLGPFLDTGKITDPLPGLGSHRWLWDTGGQVKLKALGFGVALVYGKDLRTGNNAFFVTMLNH